MALGTRNIVLDQHGKDLIDLISFDGIVMISAARGSLVRIEETTATLRNAFNLTTGWHLYLSIGSIQPDEIEFAQVLHAANRTRHRVIHRSVTQTTFVGTLNLMLQTGTEI